MENVNFSLRIPEGDDRERQVCDTCGFINYSNPKIVVGSVVTHGDKFLLCKRAIEPRAGFWTLPAGYLEHHETVQNGAIREAREEACAQIEIEALLAVYNIPRISQVQLMHVARLTSDDIAAGPESLEVGLFTWEEIPWGQLAFPSVLWALKQYREIEGQKGFVPFTNPEDEMSEFLALMKKD